jgi:periplasmic divalent cation tolerance protein
MDYSLIYCTTESRDQALGIARKLVEERLVACANLIDGATSVYWWEGKVQEEREAILLAKTSSANISAVTARILELHSYSTPCVTAIPLSGGNPAFLDWISGEIIPANL